MSGMRFSSKIQISAQSASSSFLFLFFLFIECCLDKLVLVQIKKLLQKVIKIGIDFLIVFWILSIGSKGNACPDRLINVQNICRCLVPTMFRQFNLPMLITITITTAALGQSKRSIFQPQPIHGRTRGSSIQPNNQGNILVVLFVVVIIVIAIVIVIVIVVRCKQPIKQILVSIVRSGQQSGPMLGRKGIGIQQWQIGYQMIVRT